MNDGKRELREQKRVVKRMGNQRLRRQLKRAIEESPDQAHDVEPDYGRYRSDVLNGIDRKGSSAG